MKRVTPWFPADFKPARAGVYQREFNTMRGGKEVAYSYWDGRQWFWRAPTPLVAASRADSEIYWRSSNLVPWRGLAANPKQLKGKQ